MRWWERLIAEVRSAWNLNAPSEALLARTYGALTVSGEPVSAERATGLATVWACVTLLSGTIASLPLLLYRKTEDGRERYTDHPLYDVLSVRPNPVQSVLAFWESVVTSLLLYGNGYATVTRDDDGRPRALWFVHPRRVSIDVLKTGRLKYKITGGQGMPVTVDAANMLHIVGPMSPDGYSGMSVITAARETLGATLGAERYASEFYANAAVPHGLLTHPGRLNDTSRANLRKSIVEAQTGPGGHHRTMVLEEGMAWQSLNLSNEDQQFIETRRLNAEQICQLFLVPPHLVGVESRQGLTYANAQDRALDLLKFTVNPWLQRIASAVNFALIPPLERKLAYAEHLVDAILQSDTKARYEAYQIGLSNGWLTIPEIRARENLPRLTSVPAGD